MMTNNETWQFIRSHREEAVRQLAFLGDKHPLVDMPFALDQIQGWQTARKKLPLWASCDDVVYPPHLSMEQCSSQATASYKAELVGRLVPTDVASSSIFYDFTGGFGVDFSFMARHFGRAVYVEQHDHLCAIARHNFCVLGLSQAEVVCGNGIDVLTTLPPRHGCGHGLPYVEGATAQGGKLVFYLDPARRGGHGQKVYGLTDCQPDVEALRNELLGKADAVVIKLSPMLDWHAAVKAMVIDGIGCEVHILSVGNECKELLLVLTHDSHPLKVVCVNDDEAYSYCPETRISESAVESPGTVEALLHWALQSPDTTPDNTSWHLLVPNASIMKAGCFVQVAHSYGLAMLDPHSHLYVSRSAAPTFPGRQFAICAISSMNKRELKAKLGNLHQANIAVRNFPLSADELRRRLKLRDGGSIYLFATIVGRQHLIIVAQKLQTC